MAERAVITAVGLFDPEEARIIEHLQREEPARRIRAEAKYERLERAIAGALAERAGGTPDGLRVRIDAMLIAGILRVAGGGWTAAAAAAVPMPAYVPQVVDALGAGPTPPSQPAEGQQQGPAPVRARADGDS